MQKFTIELVLPSDVDPSDLLQRAQDLAKELATEFAPEDPEGEQCEPDEDAFENAVSVQTCNFDAKTAEFYPAVDG